MKLNDFFEELKKITPITEFIFVLLLLVGGFENVVRYLRLTLSTKDKKV